MTVLNYFLLPSAVSPLLNSEFLKSRTEDFWCQKQTAEMLFCFVCPKRIDATADRPEV
jgi:hypothetical protein